MKAFFCCSRCRAGYNTIETASAGSKAPQNERYHNAQVGHAGAGRRAGYRAMADGRPHGGASDGAVLG
eukprot:2657250-Prymnesium_polylepis.1